MKSFVTNLAFSAVLTIVFSSLSACTGTTGGTNNGNTASKAGGTTQTATGTPSTYPPLASAVADGNFELLDGTTATLNMRRGDVILVNMWGIWCGPCRAEMPHLVELQDKYRDKGFKVIGFNVGDDDGAPEDPEKIKAFGEKMGLNYELVRSPRELSNQIYRVANFDGVPVSLLVDRDGHLRAVLRGGGPASIKQLKETVDRTMAN